MKRTFIAILGLLLFSAAITAQEHKERSLPAPQPTRPATRPQEQRQQGIRYTSPEGRYTVLLPAQPELSTQPMTMPDGSTATQYMAMAGDDRLLFSVSYFDYPAHITFSLDKARDGMVKGLNGTLVEEHSMSLGGAPGKQIKVTAQNEQGLAYVDRARFYDVARRVFMLQCLAPRSLDGPAMVEQCEQFFDSLKVRDR